MVITFDAERRSDSPYVERIWHSHSEEGGPFRSIAESRWEICVMRVESRTSLLVRGPETRATPAFCPPEGEWLGIRFKVGTFMPAFLPRSLTDGAAMLSDDAAETFHLDGGRWEFPTFENAETFVSRLVRSGLLLRDPVLDEALRDRPQIESLRTIQRRFARVAGMSRTGVLQIERARYATLLLRGGASIFDAAFDAGYYDQAHLTHSLKRFIGMTPAEVVRAGESQQLSFLYKTAPLPAT